MMKVPSLITLAAEALKRELLSGNDVRPDIYELPSELFDTLLTRLPPLALQKLQTKMPFKDWDDYGSSNDSLENGRKRRRDEKFNAVWKTLFKMRWPQLVDQIQTVDLQQLYWETHLQSCLEEAAELALLPSFNGLIGDIKISDTLLKYVGYEQQMNHSARDYSKLSHHCQQFGHYARCLRLPNVLCVAETCHLLRNSKLQSLVIWWIRSEEHVQGLCKLLTQNSETLTSLEFLHCKLSASFVEGVCSSLCSKRMQMHKIQHFSINTSSFCESSPSSLVLKLVSFLSSGRSLCTLKFRNSHLNRDFGRTVFSGLLEASSCLSTLELSGNNIAGWLAKYNSSGSLSAFGEGQSLESLRSLNLRGNNLRKADTKDLRFALLHMPKLESLDISDNPIEDDGIRSLIPYLKFASERHNPLAKLYLENCELSSDGVIQLLDTLLTLRRPPTSLSIADNDLGSQVAATLRNFLGSSIQVLNIGAIGLGSSGFRELKEGIKKELKLVNINISKNRGGVETANFLSKLMTWAPELVEVDATYNLMPLESLTIICSALKVAKGHLKCLDLTGNNWEYQPSHISMLSEFQRNGRPILILPSSLPSDVPYDGDP
ncbi:Leucine-rich repeat, ribonuclease inhibitor subtype [Melia azedarach]|uniref:Leucine-rich repeat, ribonuclease inhibitor subtype n=1 Tax=Melia azedarach TaxID=155640 RepID=A0ACC1YYE7_MELAZ|nr:Leucine-rich repeat, ribonuclease inhibitor subtype [Melia azedarach]